MNDAELKIKIKEIFSIILEVPIEKITDDISPHNTKKWDSLNHLKIIMEIENIFNIDILPEEAINLLTFNKALEIVKGKFKS